MSRGLRPGLKGFSRTLAAFALLAVMVRALIPAGYMVTPADQAGSTSIIMLCTAQGYVARSIDLSTGKVAAVSTSSEDHRDEPAKKSTDHPPCVFASATAVPAPETAQAIETPVQDASQTWANTAGLAPGRGLAAPPPWPTGPPLTV